MKKSLGRYGETIAQNFLKEKGYTILHTNWRYLHKEIDIIASLDSTLLFVEVKTRKNKQHLIPQEIVSKQQQKNYIECSLAYRERFLAYEYQVQFDIICVHVEDSGIDIEHWSNIIDVWSLMGSRYTAW